jgi:hypothetical protein
VLKGVATSVATTRTIREAKNRLLIDRSTAASSWADAASPHRSGLDPAYPPQPLAQRVEPELILRPGALEQEALEPVCPIASITVARVV